MAEESITITVKGSSVQAQQALKQAENAIRSMGKNTTDALSKVKSASDQASISWGKLIGGVAGGNFVYNAARQTISKFNAFIMDSIKRGADSELEMRKLKQTVENLGYSYDLHSEDIDTFLKKQMQLTSYSDEEVANVLKRLMVYTENLNEAMKQTPLVLDMVSSGMVDMDTAAKLVGFALHGNVEILSRYVPELRSSSKELDSHASKAEKTAFALGLLQEKFGGSAQAEMGTYAGQVKNLQVQWDELKEAIGKRLIPVLESFIPLAKKAIESITPTEEESKRQEKFVKYLMDTGKIAAVNAGAYGKQIDEQTALQTSWVDLSAALKKYNEEQKEANAHKDKTGDGFIVSANRVGFLTMKIKELGLTVHDVLPEIRTMSETISAALTAQMNEVDKWAKFVNPLINDVSTQITASIFDMKNVTKKSFSEMLADFRNMITQMLVEAALMSGIKVGISNLMTTGSPFSPVMGGPGFLSFFKDALNMREGGTHEKVIKARYGIEREDTYVNYGKDAGAGGEAFLPLNNFYRKLDMILSERLKPAARNSGKQVISLQMSGFANLSNPETQDKLVEVAVKPGLDRRARETYL